ncbi:MAG: hypothetical protein AMJ45_03735 [Syntrophobacter sp. DG_60]|nr:MAG: hypothetical protein AMJ45_03735 [Syntrophobacter sp. DG_60]
MDEKYLKALAFLDSLNDQKIKPGLERIKTALPRWKNPQGAFHSIHIGGTNGKGSIAAILANILKEAGYNVGIYTSPHLNCVRERIQINGTPISKSDFADLVNEIRKKNKKSLTYFEFLTLLAFIYFSYKEVEVAVIEVGMGGRWDATNLIFPKVTIISNVSLDHQTFLGNNLKSIALEKAGIIKPCIPLITASKQPSVISIFRDICAIHKAPFYLLGKDIGYRYKKGSFDYLGFKKEIPNLKLNLVGRHQVLNAAVALGALELISENFDIKEMHIERGLKTVFWPGRFEIIKRDPLIILDGAHNPTAAYALKKTLMSFRPSNPILVLGIMRDKDLDGIVRNIAPLANKVIVTAPDSNRAAQPGTLLNIVKKYNKNAMAIVPIPNAIVEAINLAKSKDTILVTGSLYTVGEARAFLNGKLD